jgi:zinc protease
MQVWYKVGSSYESNGLTGISHALEHMMFRGSKNYPGSQYDKIIAKNGGQHNAFTSQDYTAYHQFMTKEKLEICFKLEADRMHLLSLKEADFKKEISVVMEERYMSVDDDPEHRAYERFAAVAHTSSPYRHSIIGWMDDLKYLTVQDLRQWYKTWYVPNNAIIVVVGDVNHKTIYQWTKKHFSAIKPGKLPLLKPQKEILPLGMRTVTVKVPAKLPWLAFGYNTPVLPTAHKDSKWEPYALSVLSSILGLNSSSRLQKNIVRKKQIATCAYAHYIPFDRIDNLFLIGMTPVDVKKIEDCKFAILEEIENLQHKLVSEQELERVKTAWLAAKIYGKDSLYNQAHEIGALECVGLSWHEAEYSAIKHIQAITSQQVKEAAIKYLISERLTVGILEPVEIEAKKL